MTHPPINFERLGPIDMGRFERAMELAPEAIGDGQWVVKYPLDPLRQTHHVDLVSSDVPRCDCGDYVWRESLCKHILACLIHTSHPAATKALTVWMTSKRGKGR